MGRSRMPNAAELAQYVARGQMFHLEGNAAVYEETVQNMLRDISNDPVGQILVDGIHRTQRKVRIIPLTSNEQVKMNIRPCANPVGKVSPKGNECVIWYEPWSRMMGVFTGVGTSPYQVLVHELHHALRQVRGKWANLPPSLFSGFPHPEELFSVTIENMYLSSIKQPHRMNANYTEGTPLGNRTDRDWYKQYGNELEVWCRDLPDMTVQLERVYGIWNPIRVRRGVLDFVITL
jgi:hypothetical protein